MFSFGRNPYNGGSVRHVADHHSTGPHNGFPANGYVIQNGASDTDEGMSAYFRVASHGDLRADIDIVFSQTVVFDHCVSVYNAADSHIGIDIDDGTCQYGAAIGHWARGLMTAVGCIRVARGTPAASTCAIFFSRR